MSAGMEFVLLTFMGLPLLMVLLNNLLKKEIAQKICLSLGIIAGIVQMAAAVFVFASLKAAGQTEADFSQFWDLGVGASRFSVDFFSLLVLFCIGMVITAGFLTAGKTLGDKKFNFTNLAMILLLGMNGIALVTDLFSLYVFLEITGVASFVMISLNKEGDGIEGAFKYLVMSAIATVFILGGLAFLFMQSGSLQYGDVAAALSDWQYAEQPALLIAGFVLVLVGFSIKSGVMPFHGWLPDAYQSAPAAVSVILGGIVTKMAGVYALLRLTADIFVNVPVFNQILMLLAIVSIVLGAVAAITQTDFKRILAYSSISQIGYILLGASCGSAVGLIGAMLHFFNHATFKTTLFVNSAAVEIATGTTEIEKLGGLQEKMPVTGVSSILAFLSTAGIPPLAGFWSKLLIIIAAWQTGNVFIAGLALFASIFTAAYFLRLQRCVFFGPAVEGLEDTKEVTGGVCLSSLALSAITVGFGLLFPALLLFLQGQGLI
ncbi:MAG: NADH-quinone oxidoreductase subunit L [Firmicutes bacterium]|nr:NADH-quinone oxidoreductase subunit L [Bacillota bacterium]